MKRLFLFLTSVFLCLTIWATPADTCKIRITRTADGFDISAESNNVFVRQGDSIDFKNYVFVADTVVEFLCDDSIKISLQGADQKGIVTCWSQRDGCKSVPDGQKSHTLTTQPPRRNWIVLNGMNYETKVEINIRCWNGKETIKGTMVFLKCGGWTTKNIDFIYQLNGGKISETRTFQDNHGACYTMPTIRIKADDTFTQISLYRHGHTRMTINNVQLDGNNLDFNIHDKSGNKKTTDDIMIISDTEIITDSLLNKQLSGGKHVLSYKCTVLTEAGPQEITLNIPIEVEETTILATTDFNIYKIVGICIGVLLFVICVFFIILKILGKKDNGVCKNNSETGDEDGNNNPETLQEEPIIEAHNPEDIKSVIKQWNENHPENMVEDGRENTTSLLNTIAKGYISPKGKNLLETRFNDYQIDNEGLISATAIGNLLTRLYNKSAEDGAKTTSPQIEKLRIENHKLSEENTNLEGKNKTLEKERNELQNKNDKLQVECNTFKNNINQLQKDYHTLKDEKERLTQTNKKLIEQVTELKKLIDVQGQEHVAKLEGKIEQLGKVIIEFQEMVAQKEGEIAGEKEKVKKLTIQRGQWESKYNETKKKLDEADGKYKDEIDQMKDDHKAASLIQKEKYEQRLKDKDAEMANQLMAYESALEKQKIEFKEKMAHQKSESDAIQLKMKDEHTKAIDKLNKAHVVEIDRLKATIQELGINANIGREQIIAQSEELLKAISDDLNKADISVKTVVNQAPIFVSVIKKILSDLQITCEYFDDFKNGEWSAPDRSQKQVIEDMQRIYMEALGRSGWMNNVARLLSYSRLPILHDGTDLPAQLEAHGISSTLFEHIYANMVNLLGIANMGILVPAVLANNFDQESYDYKNSGTWIDQFFPKISTRNYIGKVFDIIQVGYTIKGVTEKKPIVQYY